MCGQSVEKERERAKQGDAGTKEASKTKEETWEEEKSAAELKHQENPEYEESQDSTETNEKKKMWRVYGEGEKVSGCSTATYLFPLDVFSSEPPCY